MEVGKGYPADASRMALYRHHCGHIWAICAKRPSGSLAAPLRTQKRPFPSTRERRWP